MKSMNSITAFKSALVLFLSIFIVACGGSDANDEQAAGEIKEQDHVWKDQTDALDKAREAEELLLDAQKERAKQLAEDP